MRGGEKGGNGDDNLLPEVRTIKEVEQINEGSEGDDRAVEPPHCSLVRDDFFLRVTLRIVLPRDLPPLLLDGRGVARRGSLGLFVICYDHGVVQMWVDGGGGSGEILMRGRREEMGELGGGRLPWESRSEVSGCSCARVEAAEEEGERLKESSTISPPRFFLLFHFCRADAA